MSILACHHITPHWIWGINCLKPAQFRRFLQAALHSGVRFLTLSEYIADCGQKDHPRVALTFDDGYSSVETWALPVCRELGVRATVFVLPLFAGALNTWDVNWMGQRIRHLDWQQINQLVQAGWEIGAHGLTHQDLSRLDAAECERELRLSRQLIEARTGTRVTSLAFPFGNASTTAAERARAAGYENAVVLSRTGGNGSERMTLPRIGVYSFDPAAVFVQKCLGKNQVFYHFIQGCIDICSDGTVVVKQLLPGMRQKVKRSGPGILKRS